MTAELFGLGRRTDYLSAVLKASELAATAYSAEHPHSSRSVAQLTTEVAAIDLQEPLVDLDEALQEVSDLYTDHAVYFHHPRYIAHLNCPVVLPAIAAETLIASVNSSMDTWDQSRAATLIEQRVIAQTAQWFGLPDTADGVFTSGGSQSNLQALLLARGQACEQVTGAEGLVNVPTAVLGLLRVFVAEHTHFSAHKSAGMLGLGPGSIVTVASDPTGKMCPAALEEALKTHVAQGNVPMAIVATAGSTDRGIIDPLDQIADIAHKHNVWLHVDAAVGGILAAAQTTRHRLTGVELADSITIDYHKTFFQPVSCSALLVASAQDLRHVTLHADYLNPSDAEYPNQVNKSLQTTRRFDALKMWLTLRTMGAERLVEMFQTCLETAQTAFQLLTEAPDFAVKERPHLNMVLLRYQPALLPKNRIELLNRAIRAQLLETGTACVSATVIAGDYWLKFTVLNPAATKTDVAEVLNVIRAVASDVLLRWEIDAAAEQQKVTS